MPYAEGEPKQAVREGGRAAGGGGRGKNGWGGKNVEGGGDFSGYCSFTFEGEVLRGLRWRGGSPLAELLFNRLSPFPKNTEKSLEGQGGKFGTTFISSRVKKEKV